MRAIRLFTLIVVYLWASVLIADNVTNKIAKELRGTLYSARGTTSQYALYNHKGSYLNCIQYCYRIKDVDPKAEIYMTSGNHAIVEVKNNGKTVTYSNGKVVKGSAYTKLQKIPNQTIFK